MGADVDGRDTWKEGLAEQRKADFSRIASLSGFGWPTRLFRSGWGWRRWASRTPLSSLGAPVRL